MDPQPAAADRSFGHGEGSDSLPRGGGNDIRAGARGGRGAGARAAAHRTLAGLQGAYFLFTGLWPLADLASFLAVTGPKADLWLVRFFGALVCVPGMILVHAAWRGDRHAGVWIAGPVCAAILGAGDVVFVTRGSIPPVYLIDAAIEAAFVLGWIAVARTSGSPQVSGDSQ